MGRSVLGILLQYFPKRNTKQLPATVRGNGYRNDDTQGGTYLHMGQLKFVQGGKNGRLMSNLFF